MAHLEKADSTVLTLAPPVVSVGRDAENDIVLDHDKRVSRRHAEFRLSDDQWRLVDLDSRNGTFVGDRKVHDHPLVNGDRLRIGTTDLVFVTGVDPHATETSMGARVAITDILSARECEVVALVSEGLTDKDIAARLFISPSTVRSHLDRIGEKTGLRRRSELTRLAMEHHLAAPEA